MTLRKAELLMPAGSIEKLKTVMLYGADAVYIGTPDMSLRTKSAFTLEELTDGIEFAHSRGKRVYLTLNLFSHNKDIEKLPVFLETVRKVQPDGLIISDPGIFQYVKNNAPELELHISTQANVCSWLSVKFWEDHGADLCVLGREVSFAELKEIREKCPDIKLEAFVHGSMCMTYSGRCLLSNFMAERGANQGNCAHNCRWKYKVHLRMKDIKELEINENNEDMFEFLLEEGCRPGELMPIEEDKRGSYIMNSKDLCMMPKLDNYLSVGINSLKVEGRNKNLYYLAVVTRAYRMAIDDWYKDPDNWSPKKYLKELYTIPNRGYTLAFHDGRLTNFAHNYDDSHSVALYEFAGFICEHEENAFVVEVKNRLESGTVLEFIPPLSRETVLLRIYEFFNIKKNTITDIIHGGQKPLIRIPFSLFDHEKLSSLKEKLPIGTIIRQNRILTIKEKDRLKLDNEAWKIEQGSNSEKYYNIKESITPNIDIHKMPKKGTEGCCGKGCNGCMIFWNDESYEKARQLLKTKKQGEKLS